MLTTRAARRLEAWSKWKAAAGVRVSVLGDVTAVRATENLDGTPSLTLSVPLTSPNAAALAKRVVVRVDQDDSTFDEWKVVIVTDDRKSGTRTAVCADIRTTDIAEAPPVSRTDGDGIVSYRYESVGLTPAQHITTHVLPALAAAGLTYVSAGTITPAQRIDLTFDWSSPLAVLAMIAEKTGCELDIRRIGSTGYAIDIVTKIGSSAPIVDLRIGKNLSDAFVLAQDTMQLATRLYPKGGAQGDEQPTIGPAAWQVTAITGASPYANGYSYRKLYTQDRTKISGGADLTSFPVLVSITDAALKTVANGGKVQSASGFDIRFETAAGTKLDHEVGSWSATTGALVAWVRVPTLTFAADSTFYIYYGKASVSATEETVAGVWPSIAAVYHLGDGSTISTADSGGNANTLSLVGTPTAASGKIGGGMATNGSTQYATAADAASLDTTSNLTISAWVNPSSFPSFANIVNKEGNFGLRAETNGALRLQWWDGTDIRSVVTATGAVSTSTWSHVYAVVSANDVVAIYVNGVSVGGAPYTQFATQTRLLTAGLGIGGRAVDGLETWPGSLDEIRVSTTVARSAGWVTTDYNNQNSPSTFGVFGTEQTNAGSVVTLADPAGGAGPVGFDDQLNGYYLRTPTGGLTLVSGSYVSTQTVVVASTSGISVGDAVQFRETSGGRELTYLDNPAARTGDGGAMKVGTLDRPDLPSTNNLLKNAALRDWTGSASVLPPGWTAVGSPTVTKTTAAPFTQYGGQSAKLDTTADGAGMISDAVPIAPTTLAPYVSGYAYVWGVNGAVRVELVFTTPGGPKVVPLPPNVASLSILGQWDALGVSGIDAKALGATAVQLRIVQRGTGSASFYVDAGQVTYSPAQLPFVEGSGPTQLWQAANIALQKASVSAVSYALTLVDLERMDPVTFGPDCTIVLGAVARVNDSTMAVANALVRIVEYTRDYFTPGATTVTLSSRPSDLTSLLAGGMRPTRIDPSVDPILEPGPSLDVTATAFSTTYSVFWSSPGGTPVELSINGGTYAAAPASPITVTRPAVGGTPLEYTFRTTDGVQTITDSVSIQPIGAAAGTDTDTVTPDLVVTPSNPTTTTQDFTGSATNPKSGGPAPVISVTLRGCTGTNITTSTAYADGTTYTIASGDVVRVNRPTFATSPAIAPSINYRAAISGGGAETIQRTIVAQVKTTFGPSLDVKATPGATYSISYIASGGTVELSIDGGTYATAAASPISVARPAAGAQAKSYAFRIVADGQTITDEVTVPSIDLDTDTNTVTPDVSVVQTGQTVNTVTFTLTFGNPSGGAAPTPTMRFVNTTATIGGTGYAANTDYSFGSGTVVVVDRPAFGTTNVAALKVSATISGGGTEQITRTIPNQVKTVFGPSISVNESVGDTTAVIYYGSVAGTVLLSINSGTFSTPPASPITVTRPLPGFPDADYTFSVVADGQTLTNSITVPSRDKDSGQGVECIFDPEFAKGGGDYTIYDNSAGGRIFKSISTDAAAKNGSGKALVISYDAAVNQNTNISPGFGGFYPYLVADGGVWLVGRYHRGAKLRVTIRAALPAGYYINITGNFPSGTTVDWQTPQLAQTGVFDYVAIVQIPTGGVTSGANSIGHCYLSHPSINTPGAGLVWYVYQYSYVDLNQTPVKADVPDLTVTQGGTGPTATDFTYTATNPTGGAAPTITVRVRGGNGAYIGDGAYADGNAYTVTSGSTGITVPRAAFGTGTATSVEFVATIPNGGTERIIRTVTNQVKTSFGPSMFFQPIKTTTQVLIYWSSATGSVTLSIDGGTATAAPASPITVTRPAAGAAPIDYTFYQSVDGVTRSETITIDPQESVYIGATITAVVDRVWITAVDYTANTLTVNWSNTGTIGAGSFEAIVVETLGSIPDLTGTANSAGVSSGNATSYSLPRDIISTTGPKVTYSFLVRVRDASGNTIRSSAWISVTYSYV